jgi:hypothetical protein
VSPVSGEAAVASGREEGMSAQLRQVDRRVSAVLSEMVCSLPAAGLTLHELLALLGACGPLLLCVVLTIPFLLPVSIPGLSLLFGAVIALNAMSLITHRSPWLPERLLYWRLAAAHLVPVLEKGVRLLAHLQKWIRPRLLPLTHGPIVGRVNGLLLLLCGILLMAPVPLPLSNTLPAYGALFLAIGSLERDGYAVLAGYVMVLLTLVYFVVVTMVGGVGVRTLLHNL